MNYHQSATNNTNAVNNNSVSHTQQSTSNAPNSTNQKLRKFKIYVNERQQNAIIRDFWKALIKNDSNIYSMSDIIVQIKRDVTNSTMLQNLKTTHLSKKINDVANIYKNTGRNDIPTFPPNGLLKIMLDNIHPRLPEIKYFFTHPVLTPKGELIHQDGYYPDEKLYIKKLDNISFDDDWLSVEDAVENLRDLYSDFPFQSDSDFANLLAALLQQFVKPYIDSCCPFFSIEAPTEGSGKGLLAETIVLLVTGKENGVSTCPTNEDEFRKWVTSLLLTSKEVVQIDNIEEINSNTLAATLTSKIWENRILQESRIVSLRNNLLWLTTGNNPLYSRELTRRCVSIKINPNVEKPWERNAREFKHPDLLQYLKENREMLIKCLLSIINNWLKNNQPRGDYSFGSFESWAKIIGGILDTAGVNGFLENRKALYERANPESEEMQVLFSLWYKQHKTKSLRMTEIVELLSNNDILMEKTGSGNKRSMCTKFAKYLSKFEGRIYCNLQLRKELNRHTGTLLYSLVPVNGGPSHEIQESDFLAEDLPQEDNSETSETDIRNELFNEKTDDEEAFDYPSNEDELQDEESSYALNNN